jgi:hypothetical protein
MFATMDAHTPSTHMPGYSKARLKRIIAAGNVAAMAIALWSIFLSTWLYAPILSISVLLPLCALALDIRTRGALGFEARRGRRYPLSLAVIVVSPAVALAMRAILDLNFASHPPLTAAAVFTAIATFVLFRYFDPQLRGDRNQSATIAIFALAYCFGVLAFADVVLDPSSGHETQTVVRDKRIHVSGGAKGSSVWHQVKVDPDASPAGADWINVRPDLLASYHRGDTVCVHVGRGLLAIRWYAVGHCADGLR